MWLLWGERTRFWLLKGKPPVFGGEPCFGGFYKYSRQGRYRGRMLKDATLAPSDPELVKPRIMTKLSTGKV